MNVFYTKDGDCRTCNGLEPLLLSWLESLDLLLLVIGYLQWIQAKANINGSKSGVVARDPIHTAWIWI